MMKEIIDKILFIRYIYQYKIVISEEFDSANLMMIENFNRHKDFEIFMIGIYLNKIFDIFEVIISIFHEFDDYKYLSIMNIIIIFNRQIFARLECYKMKNVIMRLINNLEDNYFRGIDV